jgi:hypothetical protein
MLTINNIPAAWAQQPYTVKLEGSGLDVDVSPSRNGGVSIFESRGNDQPHAFLTCSSKTCTVYVSTNDIKSATYQLIYQNASPSQVVITY